MLSFLLPNKHNTVSSTLLPNGCRRFLLNPLFHNKRTRFRVVATVLALALCSTLPGGIAIRSAAAGPGASNLSLSKGAAMARSVMIYRDTYGVPHIYGPTDASCVFGYAYAQAEDNFWQIEDSYIRSLGRASEVYGESRLNDDLLNRTLEITRLSVAEYKTASPRTRELCDAF